MHYILFLFFVFFSTWAETAAPGGSSADVHSGHLVRQPNHMVRILAPGEGGAPPAAYTEHAAPTTLAELSKSDIAKIDAIEYLNRSGVDGRKKHLCGDNDHCKLLFDWAGEHMKPSYLLSNLLSSLGIRFDMTEVYPFGAEHASFIEAAFNIRDQHVTMRVVSDSRMAAITDAPASAHVKYMISHPQANGEREKPHLELRIGKLLEVNITDLGVEFVYSTRSTNRDYLPAKILVFMGYAGAGH